MSKNEHTPGPWIWYGNLKNGQIWLAGKGRMTPIILDAANCMGHAPVRFNVDGVMRPGKELAVEPDHNGVYVEIDNADARLIAAAPKLLELAKANMDRFVATGLDGAAELCREVIREADPEYEP